jgi:hypothetical protein
MRDGTHLIRSCVEYEPNELRKIISKLNDCSANGGRTTFTLPSVYVGRDNKENVDKFVPIKKNEFLVPDPDFDFYIFNSELDKFIPVKSEVVKERDDLDFYIKDPSSDKMLIVDYNNIMIPSKDFDYYIYDRSTNKYIYMKNLSSFDPIQQYYVTMDQYNNYETILKFDRNL